MKTKTIISSKKLKQAIVSVIVVFGLFHPEIAAAQARSIQFESGTWEEIKAKATRENKLIFLDAYASWCRPCKWMEQNVFTNDSVADYMNARFINAKIDMEKGEGTDLAILYRVTLYPSLLFIDGNGKLIQRATGAHDVQQFIELAKEVQAHHQQHAGQPLIQEEDPGVTEPVIPNKMEIGFNISQCQKDFGFGVQFISPYFFRKTVAIRAGASLLWLEHFHGSENKLTPYQNIQVGMRGRSVVVNHNISVYGEGGTFLVLPNSKFSAQSFVLGGYGLFGFEFRIMQKFAYFIELGGVGTGATADKTANKPVYSTGFLTNAGFKFGF